MVFIFITLVLDMLALGMIVPVLPKLVEDFVHGDTARAAYIVGVFGAVWALMQFVFSPVLGALSDHYGRRPVVLLSNFGLGLDYIVMALAPTVWWLFVGRVISGITSASFSTASAYIADVTPPEKRAGAFGMLSAAFGLGFVLGPALGGVLGEIDPRLPFWVAAGLSLLNAMYGLFVLPESLAHDHRSIFKWQRANPIGSLTLLRSNFELLALAVVMFISYIAHEALPTTFVLYAMYRYHWNARMIGLAIATVGVCSALVGAGYGAAAGREIRRAPLDAYRVVVQRRRVHRLRSGADGINLLVRDSSWRTRRSVRSTDAGFDDATGNADRAGATAGSTR